MNENTNPGTGRHAGNNPNDDRARLQELIGPDYRLQWIVGHGGMSTVWLADDTVNDREVAIKALRPEYSNSPEFLERFRNEANAAMDIDSPNVVATYDYREVPDQYGTTFCFIVMEFIRGESLADLLARRSILPEEEALQILYQAASGLAAIHEKGLVHRDIKPGNLMITQNGVIKISDFGIAKAAAAVPLTRTGMVVGTAQYVSPEQAQGKNLTSASDVYSWGVVGYEMLSGHRPFTGDSSVSVVLAHINQAPAALSTAISAETRELISIAMRKVPAERFATGTEAAGATAEVLGGQRPTDPRGTTGSMTAVLGPDADASTAMLTTARPQPAPAPRPAPAAPVAPREVGRREATPKKGNGFAIGLGIAVLIAALGAGGLWWMSSSNSKLEPETPTTTQQTMVVTETVTPTVTTQAPPPTTSARPEPTTPEVTETDEPTLRPTTPATTAPTRASTPAEQPELPPTTQQAPEATTAPANPVAEPVFPNSTPGGELAQ
ncbi:serine/threonine protein kinase [Corynebacterium renale]|uniref:non-specific serine/threonine protein kinase n=2 Tax=Corynebacterium renale TaxID=1724 RepID=A0A2A9DNX2_9CORY|nr:serine/threonine protein kinase [Corynebacterium renale]SQI22817.1 serine/threonine protein kinase [Corynebacterium renale]